MPEIFDEPEVLGVPEVEDFSSVDSDVSEAGLSLVAAGVPWMVIEPMPEALESKLFWVPFSVTVTAPGLPARMVMESVTVYVCSQGPVTVLATSLVPSFVISSHEVSPLATETVTSVSVVADESLVEESALVVPSAFVVVVVGVDEEPVSVSSVELESVDVVLTGTVVLPS